MKQRVPYSTKHFVWLHTPKTGGTWLYRILTQLAPPSWEAVRFPPAHVRLAEVPGALASASVGDRASLPLIAHVRNPWAWYVSLYFFMEQHYVNRTGGFSVPRARWSPGCDHWARFFSHGNNVDGFRKGIVPLLDKMHDEGNEAVAPPQHVFLRSADGSLGVQHVVRFEQLREGIVGALRSTGASVPPPMTKAIMERRPQNTSSHGPYRRFYTPDLAQVVAERERWVIEQMGYEF
jgi:hypothetical protein